MSNIIQNGIGNVNISNGTGNNITNPYANMNLNNTGNSGNTGNNEQTEIYYKGFVQKGNISIPKTGLECPILENATSPALEVAVAIQFGPGLNEVGNTVIAGHNYHNGLFFSNNNKIETGDQIYIRDRSGTTVKYIVYSKFETTSEDTSYINRNTNGAREITLYTCNDDSSKRIILLAKEE